MKRAIPCLLLLLSAPPIQAMPWQALQDEIARVEAGQTGNAELVRRLEDIVQTMVILTRAQRTKDANSLLFCVPPGTAMQRDEVVSLIRHRARSTKAATDTPVQQLLLDALRQRYPCSGD